MEAKEGRREGRKEGRKEGRREGRREGRKEEDGKYNEIDLRSCLSDTSSIVTSVHQGFVCS